MIDPEQEIFTELLVKLRESLDCEVYDGALPPEGTAYPFVFIGNTNTVDRQLKGAVICTVTQAVHVYSEALNNRGDFSNICYQIKQIARSLRRTKHYGVHVRGIDQAVLPDNTTQTPLLHADIQIQYQCS